MVVLGSASHVISLERRKVAWAWINPKLKILAKKKVTSLVLASWRRLRRSWNQTRPLPRSPNQNFPPSNRARFSKDNTDLRSFIGEECCCLIRWRKITPPTAVSSSKRFQSGKYFQKALTAIRSWMQPLYGTRPLSYASEVTLMSLRLTLHGIPNLDGLIGLPGMLFSELGLDHRQHLAPKFH